MKPGVLGSVSSADKVNRHGADSVRVFACDER